MSSEQKGTWIWRTVVTVALVALATLDAELRGRDRVGVAACVDVLLKELSSKSSGDPAEPYQSALRQQKRAYSH